MVLPVQQLIRLAIFGAGAFLLLDNRHKKMPAVQASFEKFHHSIRLGEEDEKAKLREKREIILSTLLKHSDISLPPFESFQQGSYAMHTGTMPLDGEFDIDIGLVFDCSKAEFPDPVRLKAMVRDALNRNGRTMTIRRSCVTAHYKAGADMGYHVDLAIYTRRSDGCLDIAKGKEHSTSEHRYWEKSDPLGLTDLLSNRFKGEALSQYRRCIRYMKRWRDVQFSSGAPLSIALTVAAYRWLEPHQPFNDKSFDLIAMHTWTKKMLSQFSSVKTSEGTHLRLQVFLPVEPKVDLFKNMTKAQMGKFHSALSTLHSALTKAYDQATPEACLSLLSQQFGNDFPGSEEVPALESTKLRKI